MINSETKRAIREAFLSGQLLIQTVDPSSGEVSMRPIGDVLKHSTSHKPMVRTTLVDGRSVETTIDHSLFIQEGEGIIPVEAGTLTVGDQIATVADGELKWVAVFSVEPLPPEEFTYDLSIPGPQNFLLENGILAHNSYNIGGISLDIDKSSKYQSLSDTAESQWDKLTETKKATTLILRGLRQQRFSPGVRSSFGANLGKGILSPRNFL